MKNLIFVGGAKGVGKTSVLNKISSSSSVKIINTGKIYRSSQIKKINPEESIFNNLIRHIGIVDTHYVGYKEDDFVRGLSSKYLLRLNEFKEIGLVLIDLNADELFERRKLDFFRERIINYSHMERELEMNRVYFEQYCKDLKIAGHIIFNRNLETCVSELGAIINE